MNNTLFAYRLQRGYFAVNMWRLCMKSNKLLLIKNYILILLAGIFLGTVLIVATYALPTDKVHKHIRNSIEVYRLEGNNPQWGGTTTTRMDNFTTAIMIQNTVPPKEFTAIEAALLNPSLRWPQPSINPAEILVKVMEDQIPNNSFIYIYPRYWHGYLVFLKPMLEFFKIKTLREINAFFQFWLMVVVSFLTYKRLGVCFAFALLFALSSINPITAALDFQIATIFYILLFSLIFMLKKNDFLIKDNNYNYFFLIMGIVTVYFDFLTYPMVTFGIPFCMYVILNKDKTFLLSYIESFKNFIKKISLWSFGYLGMWFGKWIIASIFTNVNVFIEVFSAAQNEGGRNVAIIDIIVKNLNSFFKGPTAFLVSCLLLYLLFLLIKKKENFFLNKSALITFVPIIILPFAWYFALMNHSYIHAEWLAYRELSMSIFAAMCLFFECKRKSNDN